MTNLIVSKYYDGVKIDVEVGDVVRHVDEENGNLEEGAERERPVNEGIVVEPAKEGVVEPVNGGGVQPVDEENGNLEESGVVEPGIGGVVERPVNGGGVVEPVKGGGGVKPGNGGVVERPINGGGVAKPGNGGCDVEPRVNGDAVDGVVIANHCAAKLFIFFNAALFAIGSFVILLGTVLLGTGQIDYMDIEIGDTGRTVKNTHLLEFKKYVPECRLTMKNRRSIPFQVDPLIFTNVILELLSRVIDEQWEGTTCKAYNKGKQYATDQTWTPFDTVDDDRLLYQLRWTSCSQVILAVGRIIVFAIFLNSILNNECFLNGMYFPEDIFHFMEAVKAGLGIIFRLLVLCFTLNSCSCCQNVNGGQVLDYALWRGM